MLDIVLVYKDLEFAPLNGGGGYTHHMQKVGQSLDYYGDYAQRMDSPNPFVQGMAQLGEAAVLAPPPAAVEDEGKKKKAKHAASSTLPPAHPSSRYM